MTPPAPRAKDVECWCGIAPDGHIIPLYIGLTRSTVIARIVSAKGYVKGNVQIISWRANKLRADASVQELKCVLAYAKNPENRAYKGFLI